MASIDRKWEMNCDDFKCIEDPAVGELGGGAQSIVRLTFHTTLGPVAVKCFLVTGGAPDRRRLESKINRELQILQKAGNEFIVHTHGWVKWSKAMGLVMEYLPVGSLRQFTFDSFAKLSPKIILRMAHEIASAIAYMHNPLGDHRVVHGDLKPENVLLTNDLHCKVGDFGSAELAALTGSATLTGGPKRENTSMTLAYAAPEKLKKPNIKPKKEQDTYSFGMLLYVLLTGSAPYTHPSHEITFVESIKQGERPDTEEIDELKEAASTKEKHIIEVLESIIRKCWQQDPSDRPNMIAVRDQLHELRDQQSDADTLAEVFELLQVMSLSPPIANQQRLVPLHHFSPISGNFAGGGTVYNIYNLPNVQQAAINCDVVQFEQDASGIAAPGELPEKRSTMNEAFKVQDASPTSEQADPSTYSAESVKPIQQSVSQERPVPSLRRSHGEMKQSSSWKVSGFDDDDAISTFERAGSSTSSAPPAVDSDNVRRSDENATDASYTSTVTSIRSRVSFFETAAAVKPMQQPASQQRPAPSLRRSHGEMKKSSSSKVSGFDDDDDDDDDDAISTFERAGSSTSSAPSVKPMQQPASQQRPAPSLRRSHSEMKKSSSSKVSEFDDDDKDDDDEDDEDDDAISTFERAGSSTSSAPSGNTAVTRSSEKKPTLDEVFEALVDDTGNSRRRNDNVKESSSTSNVSSIRSFFKNTSRMKQFFKKKGLSASSGQTWLPSNVRPAPGFLEKYKVSLKNHKYEEAKTMTTTITSMIEDNIDATAKDVRKFGIKLRGKKLFLESIAIFDAASAMFEKMGKTEENLEWMRICVGEMRDTNEAMIGDDVSMKVTVRNFVIPLMREKLRHIEDTSLVSEQFKCHQVCYVLHFIEWSEYLVDEWEEREKTLRFALTRMKFVFKADVLKFQVYGLLLNNLGHVCELTSRFEEAASFYKQAIDVYKAATDYYDEEERKEDIAQSENNLKLVQQKMR